MWFCRIDSETLRIVHYYQADGPAFDGDLEFPGEPSGSFYEPTRDPETGAISLVENIEKKTQAAWTALRTERNARLAASDYTQLQDAHLSAEKKSAWADYRQALRDLPDETTNPLEAEWPPAPGTSVPVAPVSGSRLSSLLDHAGESVQEVEPVVEAEAVVEAPVVPEAEPVVEVQEVAAVEPVPEAEAVVESPVVVEAEAVVEVQESEPVPEVPEPVVEVPEPVPESEPVPEVQEAEPVQEVVEVPEPAPEVPEVPASEPAPVELAASEPVV